MALSTKPAATPLRRRIARQADAMSDDTTAHPEPGSADARKPSGAREPTGAAGPTAAPDPADGQEPGDGSKSAEPNVPEPGKQSGKPIPAPKDAPPDKS